MHRMDAMLKLGILLVCSIIFACCQEIDLKSTEQEKPQIYFLHVKSEIKYRFSKTVITSKVVNPSKRASEALFDVTLPNEAFMTAFKLITKGTEYTGKVKEKEEAKKEYDRAKSRGQSAGHIVAKPRDSNKFQIQINVAAGEKVTFELTYRELLRRRVGNYEQLIYINPGQVVEDFRIDVSIEEYRNITTVNVPPLRNDLLTGKQEGKNSDAEIVHVSPTEVKISYFLTRSQQEALSEQGISGQFVVQYDIQREKDSGEVLVMDGFFVHYLSPADLNPMAMDIVFILDRSGSMTGNKMKQLQESMLKILDEINSNDRLMLIAFDDRLKFWRRELVQATSANIENAKTFIRNTGADGSTDINLAMTEGLQLLTKETRDSRAPVLVFLTDGQPTSGVTNTFKILQNVKKFNEVNIPIFSLAFGRGADFRFTKKVAAQNNGLGKKIYEDSDAALQISGFYQEISTVLMRNVSFKYVDGSLNDSTVTKTNFNTFFRGSELIVAGQVNDVSKLQDGVDVSAIGFDRDGVALRRPVICIIPPTPPILPAPTAEPQPKERSIMENVWAYLTIKQLLRKKDSLDDKNEIKDIDKKILAMSLKYQFVTPLTSMVVTIPDDLKPSLRSVDSDQDLAVERNALMYNPNRQISTSMYSRIAGLPGRSSYVGGGLGTSLPSYDPQPFLPLPSKRNRKRIAYARLPRVKKGKRKGKQGKQRRKTSSNSFTPKSQFPSFLVNISSVEMCFDLPMEKSKMYNIIKITQQKDGCTMSANIDSKQKSITTIKIEKFAGKTTQETFVAETSKAIPSFQCNADGISLGLSDTRRGLQVKAEFYGRQRKQYTGILSHFANVKCKIVKQLSRKGKLIAKIKCTQKGKQRLKLKAVEKQLQSGDTCWFLNKRMVKLLNISPANYEVTP